MFNIHELTDTDKELKEFRDQGKVLATKVFKLIDTCPEQYHPIVVVSALTHVITMIAEKFDKPVSVATFTMNIAEKIMDRDYTFVE